MNSPRLCLTSWIKTSMVCNSGRTEITLEQTMTRMLYRITVLTLLYSSLRSLAQPTFHPTEAFPPRSAAFRLIGLRVSSNGSWYLTEQRTSRFPATPSAPESHLCSPAWRPTRIWATNHAIVKAATLAFWRWTLLEDENAMSFLNYGLAETARPKGRVERKTKVIQSP
jgi:hypothetical protein